MFYYLLSFFVYNLSPSVTQNSASSGFHIRSRSEEKIYSFLVLQTLLAKQQLLKLQGQSVHISKTTQK